MTGLNVQMQALIRGTNRKLFAHFLESETNTP
jgi:hypothetical protein